MRRLTNGLVYVLGRAAIELAARIPERMGYGLAAALGRCWFRVAGRRRRSAMKFLRIAYPDRSDSELARLGAVAAGNLCKVPIDMARITRLLARGGDVLGVVDTTELVAQLPAAKPYLALSAHLGSWEMAAVVMARLAGEAHGVARTFKNPLLQRWILGNREGAGLHIYPRRGGIRGMAKAVLGGAVGLQVVDQHQRLRGVRAPFFGHDASCERAAASLALRHGLPIVVGVAVRVGAGFRFRMLAAETFTPQSTGDKAADLVRTITAINVRLEQLIRQAPEQYVWLHDRFRAPTPAAEPADEDLLGEEATGL
jgi:KDO2-lipid IV(A) lauroyltransferase